MVAIPEGYGQANFIFGGNGVPTGAEITLGFDVPSGTPTPASVGATLVAGWTATMRPTYIANCTMTGVLVKFGPNDTGPSAITPAAVTGTASGDADSPNVALLVHKNTAFGGRSGKGRFYQPAAPTTAFDTNGLVLAPALTAFNAAYLAWYNRLVTDGIGPFLLHSENAPLTLPTPILSFTVDTRAATQRRRLRR